MTDILGICRKSQNPAFLVGIKPYSQDDEDYYSQAGALFRLMSDDQKQQLAGNIAGGLGQANSSIPARMLGQLKKADPQYAEMVLMALAELEENTLESARLR